MPRLSFLALPWLVREREIRTTERVTTERVETGTTPSTDRTPETTTVYRLLRDADGSPRRPRPRRDDSEATGEPSSGTPDSDTTPSDGADLRGVLAWHPILIDGSTFAGRIGDEPTDRTVSTEPTPVAWTLRSFDHGERPGDGGVERAGGTDAAAGATENRRVGREPRTAVETADRADLGTSTAPVGIARPWLPDAGTPGETRRGTGIGRSALGIRPRLSTGPTPTVLARLGPGSRAGPVEPLLVGGSASASGTPARGTPDPAGGRSGPTPGTAADDATAPGAVERPALILPGGQSGPGEIDGRPGPTGGDIGRAGPASDDGTGPLTLTYRDAGARDGGVRGVTRTPGRRRVDPSAPPTAATAESVGQNGSMGRAGGSVEDATATGTGSTTDPHGKSRVPDVPFASFPDTDAAIDHVYREIERRWRIDRERRGL
ncbi:MAG: hypothetical protein V5A62_05990 [Haloarculaceae archaeon]